MVGCQGLLALTRDPALLTLSTLGSPTAVLLQTREAYWRVVRPPNQSIFSAIPLLAQAHPISEVLS
jgi:hypothetical protein